MPSVITHTDTLSPWSDVNRIFANAKKLVIVADGKTHTGNLLLDNTDGVVTLSIGEAPKPAKDDTRPARQRK